MFLEGDYVAPEDRDADGASPPPPEAAPPAKAAKKKRKRGKPAGAADFEASRSLAAGIPGRPAAEQAAWLAASYCQHTGGTALECEGLGPEAVAELPSGRNLEERLKRLEPTWAAEFASATGHRRAGEPSALFISPSAVGAIAMIKACPGFNSSCRVAKLFAKHLKVAEQEVALRQDRICIGAGTPNRLAKLAEGGALQLGRLRYVVVDVGLDVKQRTLLDMPEVRADWWALWEQHVKALVVKGRTRLVLYSSHAGGDGS